MYVSDLRTHYGLLGLQEILNFFTERMIQSDFCKICQYEQYMHIVHEEFKYAYRSF